MKRGGKTSERRDAGNEIIDCGEDLFTPSTAYASCNKQLNPDHSPLCAARLRSQFLTVSEAPALLN